MVKNFAVYNTNSNSVNVLYKTFYYDLDQFINGDYSPVNVYIDNFTDLISLYSTPDRTDIPTSTLGWNNKTIVNPLDNSKRTSLESISISLPDNKIAFFGGSYTSSNSGFYEVGNPAVYVLKENGGVKTLFSKLKISVIGPSLRKVNLYTPMKAS